MRHSLAKFVFVLVLVKIDQLDSRPVEVVFTGHGCHCKKNLPYQINVPVEPEPGEQENRSYGYKIEKPPQSRAKYSYSFDFVVEEPIQPTPKPSPKENLFARIDRIAVPKPDCEMETIRTPVPEPRPHPPRPTPKPCKHDRTKVCTCETCARAKPPADYDYEVEAPVKTKSCECGQCHPSNTQWYVLSDIETNRIGRLGGRSKRDVFSKLKPFNGLRNYMKTMKSTRDARKSKKSKIVKRDIKGEYDLLQKDHSDLDLTIPDIIQYMPETLMPTFKRGKCNISCKNRLSKHKKEEKNNSSPETANNDGNRESQPSEKNSENSNETTQTLLDQQLRINPLYSGASYLKRSVNPYHYPYPCYPALMPPPYIPNPLHLATLAQNPGNPIWYQPRPLIDPNGHYVYDRLGHKYEVKNGSLKLVTPHTADGVNVSAPAFPVVGNTEEKTESTAAQQSEAEINTQISDQQEMLPSPIVGAPAHYAPPHDPQMDKVIRDIIYQHPDFVDATQHAEGSLTQPQQVQSDETMQFLDKLIRGRLNNWFGVNEEVPSHNLQDLDRYSRETGTSIKFIPVVTVDKEKMSRYCKSKAQEEST